MHGPRENLPVSGRTDEQDRLVFADDTLASLQARCGGALPGAIAIPELRELVTKARRFGTRVARDVEAFDGDRAIRTWAQAQPDKAGKGCIITLADWQSGAPGHSLDDDDARRLECDRATADLVARLDPEQRIIQATGIGPDLDPIVDRMNDSRGARWTECVTLDQSDHSQPMHWRLLDGATCRIEGSERQFTVRLLPLGRPDPGSDGFELLMIAHEPAPVASPPPARPRPSAEQQTRLSGELGPVLRQPIARIIANAETIRARLAGPLGDEYSNYAADIATAGQHLLALVEDLADLEVVESAGFTTAPDRIDLVEVAQQATGILSVRAREKDIALHGPEGSAKLAAIGEFRRVLQILLNVVGNAINYAPSGSNVTIAARSTGGKAFLSIADEGPGMNAGQVAKVFEKFERLGRSGDGGSGLGLHISRRLARAMDGDLVVQSEEGKGATFTLILPEPTAND